MARRRYALGTLVVALGLVAIVAGCRRPSGRQVMRTLAERYAIVIVTHNMQQAARVAADTAFMLLGELVEFGATARAFENPKDKRTEDYVSGRYG
jgi:ABC-type phosphate transport system ATPase subunit